LGEYGEIVGVQDPMGQGLTGCEPSKWFETGFGTYCKNAKGCLAGDRGGHGWINDLKKNLELELN